MGRPKEEATQFMEGREETETQTGEVQEAKQIS